MKVLEHRRHAMRHKPGEHLTKGGVNLARRVGADLGRLDLVITSSSPRAYETAIAMGFAADEEIDAHKADEVRAAGKAAIGSRRTNLLLKEPWAEWKPDPEWSTPALPEGWNVLD